MTEDVTPGKEAGYNVRTTVHEYGGGALIAGSGVVYFSNFKCALHGGDAHTLMHNGLQGMRIIHCSILPLIACSAGFLVWPVFN